jgi:hypothetical protein
MTVETATSCLFCILQKTSGSTALTVFSQIAPRRTTVVELRYFGGLTTIRHDWDLAKAWLLPEVSIGWVTNSR